ncbi:MAG: excinuclease ABC subunit UvrA [Myxococcales bacterium]|nr:excinuclease ABC subunit UvrA [Myxococcales bacterium]
MAEPTHIRIRNARTHNLVGVDLDVPRHRLVVFTGVSGSGKSSLAYDTIFKEGQRRFVESLSAYARQFLGQMDRPEVDAVEGVSPTLSIDQKTVNRNPRSTVGTVTEIYDHLRLLLARLGTPHCPECGREVSRLSTTQIVDRLLQECVGQRLMVLGPVVRERKGEYRKELADLLRDGWVRARVDGEVIRLEEPPTLARYEKHTIEVVVDRVDVDAGDRSRLAEAVETAAELGAGTLVIVADGQPERTYSTQRACPDHPEVSIPELEPRLFSFNAPQGACEECNGLGALERFVEGRIVDRSKPAIDAFQAFNDEGRLAFAHFDRSALELVIGLLGQSARKKLSSWPKAAQRRLVHGDPDLTYEVTIERGTQSEVRQRPWRGLVPMVEMIWKYTSHGGLERFRERSECPACRGERLNAVARAVRFREVGITTLSRMSVHHAHSFFADLTLEGSEAEIGNQLIHEIRGRLEFLDEVGLGYLTLDRTASSLSGGESQRIRLAAQVGSALQGVTYVLDEPSIGLHPRDNRRLLGALRRLRDRGNSVLVVEHDAETILAADHVVDVGPGAGRDGGHVVAAGTPKQLIRSKKSPTAAWLRGEARIEVPPKRRKPKGWLKVKGAEANNLTGVDAELPLGCLVVVTGVSGSGKSSLTFEVVEASVRAGKAVRCKRISGLSKIDKLVRISQTPIGRTPRSNPATYTKVFDPIRDLFAQTAEARARAYKKGRFSFNVAGGRCEACQGAGVRLIEMQFLPPVAVQCEVCEGKRFNAETLEITWKGLTINDVLSLSVAEAHEVFSAIPKISRILGTLVDVGLGYLPLGQPSTTLSGGEAQRVKLASELHRPATGQTLYLLDEPTTGLHFSDVALLISALQRLVDQGNSVVVVEHHTDVIKCADRLLDMGPEGGEAGGRLIGTGTPEELARLDTPTGRVLAELPELTASASSAPLAAEHAPAYQIEASKSRPRVRASMLTVRGARMHNLRGVDVDLPHNKMTVITGVSGSGKTSLAFDTIFAEGQRQYVESLSTYARRFLGRLERAPVDRIEGLQPAIAIDQRTRGHNPRSTVATVTELHDVLRVLYARIGQAHCPECDQPVRGWPPAQAAVELRGRGLGAGYLLAQLRPAEDPPSRRKGLLQDGWTRLLTEQGEVDLTDDAALPVLGQGAQLVVDRVAPGRASLARVVEAVEAAYRLGGGAVTYVPRKGGDSVLLSARAECAEHGVVQEGELTPRHFSFNGQLGACLRCDGVGRTIAVVQERLITSPSCGIWDAMDARVSSVLARSARNRAMVEAVLAMFDLSVDTPVEDWPAAARSAVLDGVEAPITVRWTKSWGKATRNVEEQRSWPGILALLEGWSARLDWLTAEQVCPGCAGGRLRRELLAVKIGGLGIADLCAASVAEARDLMADWTLSGADAVVAERPLQEVRRRLGFLVDVGLGYITLDRAAETLSGGESQRIRLASQLGADLCGVTYVLDEPTVGLHASDTERLLQTLESLRDQGNTVLLVEHDPETIQRADHVVDLGPEAGVHGGRVIAQGTPAAIAADPASVTGAWLSGQATLPERSSVREARSHLTVRGACAHNLRGTDVRFPTGVWVAVSGVSGSGKSTLVMDTLAPALRAHLGQQTFAANHAGLEMGEEVDRVVLVDQSPIGRTPRSTPVTYTKIWDGLRKLYAGTRGAMERGWKPGRFSFNAAAGRCSLCEGRGAILVEMHFLPDVWVTCDGCGGKRYSRETLEVRWRGRSIADVLAMRADEAHLFFENHRSIARKLKALVDVGLGYLTLGQPATTLSGGEAQRVKLAAELTSRKGHAVYVLDEPTTGLHLADVARLVDVLHRLVDEGHTVITIEHHIGMLLQADHLIDLGPAGGDDGGHIVATGAPRDVAKADTATGRALARELEEARGRRRRSKRRRSTAGAGRPAAR